MTVQVEHHMPSLFAAAERISAGGQRRFKRMTIVMLVALTAAAVGGVIERPWAGWISLVAFGLGILVLSLAGTRTAKHDWYDGRAGAESAKSLTWKYAVGGEPFAFGASDAAGRYVETLTSLVAEFDGLDSALEAPATAPDLGPLTRLRDLDLAARTDVYRDQRLEDQRDWYARQAADHRKTASNWRIVLTALQAIGLVVALLKGLDVLHVDLLGLFATAAAAAAAWLAAGDYAGTARAYDYAVLELDAIVFRLRTVASETAWATFVADAESAMSREHAMWLSRQRAA